MHIKKDDIVVVIAGKDKGKKGKVLQVIPKKERVLVEGVNMATKHVKPSQKIPQGGIVHQEAPIHVSNVMLWDEKAKSGTRVRYEFKGDKKVRVAVKSGNVID